MKSPCLVWLPRSRPEAVLSPPACTTHCCRGARFTDSGPDGTTGATAGCDAGAGGCAGFCRFPARYRFGLSLLCGGGISCRLDLHAALDEGTVIDGDALPHNLALNTVLRADVQQFAAIDVALDRPHLDYV